MKRLIITAVFVSLVLGCQGCGSTDDPADEPGQEQGDGNDKGNDNGNKDEGDQGGDDGRDPLDDFNNFPPSVIEIDNNKEGATVRVVVLGNSIAFHGKAPDIGWHFEHGMAASAPEKDYVHLLFSRIEEAAPGRRVRLGLYNVAGFEREYGDFDFGEVSGLQEFQPHIVVFQIGENVSLDGQGATESFVAEYGKLIEFFRTDNSPVVICTLPFFPSDEKNEAILRVVESTGTLVANLSSLVGEDPENYAINEKDYPGDKSIWLVDGIGIHPGDKGMSNIARVIFSCIEQSGCLDN